MQSNLDISAIQTGIWIITMTNMLKNIREKDKADEKEGEFQNNFGIYKKKQMDISELKIYDTWH